MKKLLIMALLLAAIFMARAVDWRGIDDSSYYAGQKITAADLEGKVILVDCWGVQCPPCRAMLPIMESLWKRFKARPFILLGSHRQGRQSDQVAELVKANKLTYPMYERAGIAVGEPSFRAIPFMYVVNHRGQVVYSGDNARDAISAVVDALDAIGAPPSLISGATISKKSPYKMLEKQLVLGKSTVSTVKKLQDDVKRASSKLATPAQKAMAEEAEAILKELESSKVSLKEEIEAKKSSNPVEALKLMKGYILSFPDESAAYRSELVEMTQKAKEWMVAQKAKAAEAN